jgi:hypothetical protein
MKTIRWTWVTLAVLLLGACQPAAPQATFTGGPTPDPNVRVRAWLLFQAADATQSAGKLEAYLTMGEDSYVVVRVDVVDGDYNLVVPVDTASHADLLSLVATLGEVVGSEPAVLIVAEHHPEPVTQSHSYVTEPEREPYPADFPEPGRQVPNSPGANPWG